jgi:Bacterial PH domain
MLSSVPPTVRETTRAVFRLPLVALAAVILLAICATPFAFAAPWLWLIYLVPAGLAWCVLRLRTDADARGIRVRQVFTSRRLPWDDVAGLRLRGSKRVRAVLHDGAQVALPNVRAGDVPALALVSGGRLADPRGETRAEPDAPTS